MPKEDGGALEVLGENGDGVAVAVGALGDG